MNKIFSFNRHYISLAAIVISTFFLYVRFGTACENTAVANNEHSVDVVELSAFCQIFQVSNEFREVDVLFNNFLNPYRTIMQKRGASLNSPEQEKSPVKLKSNTTSSRRIAEVKTVTNNATIVAEEAKDLL